MTHPLLVLGPGGEYRYPWPEEDETMKTEPKHKAADDIPGWTKARQRIHTYPTLRASHDRLLEACKAALVEVKAMVASAEPEPVTLRRTLEAGIAKAEEVTG